MITASAIETRDEERRVATVALDLASLEAIFSDQLVWVHSSGIVDSKDSLMRRFSEGTARCHRIETFRADIRLFGATGVVTGLMDMDAEWDKVRKTAQSRFTAVWVETTTGVQLVSWHSCRAA